MICDGCGNKFRYKDAPVKVMTAFYAIFACPHCLSALKPGKVQISLITIFGIFLIGAIISLSIDFARGPLNFAVPSMLFSLSGIAYIANLFCEKTVMIDTLTAESESVDPRDNQ